MAFERFELVEHEDSDGYSGLGSGYFYIVDTLYNKPVHDENDFLIIFDIEEGNISTAKDEGKRFIRRNYKQLAELMDERENA